MRPHHVNQLILGTPLLPPLVRQQDRGATHPEQTVRQQHRPLVPLVVVRRDDLRAHHDRVGVRDDLEQVPGQVDGDDPCAAPHAGQVEALDVAAELVLVDDHGREGGGGGEEAAVDDEDVDVFGLEVGFLEEGVEGGEDDDLGLAPGGGHGGGWGDVVDGRGEAGFLAEAGAFQDSHLEVHAFGTVLED